AWSSPAHAWPCTPRGADGAVQQVVSAFAGSAPALAALEVAVGPATWRRRLAALPPDPHLDGAAAPPPRACAPGAPAVLPRPVGPLHFAGEHTAGPWSGLMEGALRSGHRAAAEL